MNSSIIGKIEKAHRYAQEPERINIGSLTATFRGGHDEYQLHLTDGLWECNCHTFTTQSVGTCSHVMALQQVLSPMLTDGARFGTEELPAQEVATAPRQSYPTG